MFILWSNHTVTKSRHGSCRIKKKDPKIVYKDRIIEKPVEKVIEKVVEVEANIDVSTPAGISELEEKLQSKLKEIKND